METTVIKNGNSQAIRLSKQLMTQAGLNIGDELTIELKDNALIFEKKEDHFKNRLRKFYQNKGTYNEEFIDYGESVGEEW
ncbi:AbrB/MazE/SpoVT family DNA-binding domain-containing protein [Hutsoniella sourekii]|uniref:AbrB/MazE/SpoVT family DNA-binding domain-containing protein n=1 Tax=Hutsoniella sourekii TaxID=87650 RepID=UPI0004ACAC1A|nr:AbrB/MazE/SpoVT family DNA-binding domain-containing protein [Hutsoniella sourekii]